MMKDGFAPKKRLRVNGVNLNALKVANRMQLITTGPDEYNEWREGERRGRDEKFVL